MVHRFCRPSRILSFNDLNFGSAKVSSPVGFVVSVPLIAFLPSMMLAFFPSHELTSVTVLHFWLWYFEFCNY